MMNPLRYSAAAALILSALAAPAVAQPIQQDAVIDMRKDFVRDMRGNCVRTKWEVSGDPCLGMAPAAAEPSPYAQPQNYLVFFDFDRADITPESRSVLETVANEAAHKGTPHLMVTGHADRAGTDAYNMRLSERRAQAVRKTLGSLGLKDAGIVTQAKGEADPLVPTEDGVREPQNRRVEIQYLTK